MADDIENRLTRRIETLEKEGRTLLITLRSEIKELIGEVKGSIKELYGYRNENKESIIKLEKDIEVTEKEIGELDQYKIIHTIDHKDYIDPKLDNASSTAKRMWGILVVVGMQFLGLVTGVVFYFFKK